MIGRNQTTGDPVLAEQVRAWCLRTDTHVVIKPVIDLNNTDNTDAPLCRHHHRLKTHTAWTYRPFDPITDPGTYLWTDPHHVSYRRTPTGTTCITQPST